MTGPWIEPRYPGPNTNVQEFMKTLGGFNKTYQKEQLQ